MTRIDVEILLIAVVVAVSCALPGVFLVLRRTALLSDAISHTVLLGIVLAFFVVESLASPLLIVAAAATGVLTVTLVELLARTRLVKQDAAIGLVFPALFSIAVILISRYAGNVHLDIDAVLLGELAFAPLRRLEIAGSDLGPRTLYVMGTILLLNVGFLLLFYKELKLSTFDPTLAAALGFAPAVVHYGFMSLVSLTAVGAFDAVGSILVVALMIAPPATAYLLTDRLRVMLSLSAGLAAIAAIGGYWAAVAVDTSIAGAMAVMSGLIFLLAFALAPERGLVALARRRARQRVEFAQRMLAAHLLHHEGSESEDQESRAEHLEEHFRWQPAFARRIVGGAVRNDLVRHEGTRLRLTDRGRAVASQTPATG